MKNVTTHFFKSFLITISCFLISNHIQSQSLSEQLGGVKTNFTIISNDSILTIENQIIIKRAVAESNVAKEKDSYYDGAYGWAYGYGLGYEAYHLEFISKEAIQKKLKLHRNVRPRKYIEVALYDEKGTFIGSKNLKTSMLTESTKAENHYVYSLNLKAIPIILLDKTKKMKIRLMEVRRK